MQTLHASTTKCIVTHCVYSHTTNHAQDSTTCSDMTIKLTDKPVVYSSSG